MATTSRVIDAGPAAVYAVLADGWTYGQWVVGTSHVRAVDAQWPAPGSRLHHAVGPWPLVVRDHTEVRESQRGRRLLLTARGWPFGEAEVELTLATRRRRHPADDPRDARSVAPEWLLRNPVG